MAYASPLPVAATTVRPADGEGRFFVASTSKPDGEYVVDIPAGTCGCPAGEHHFESCTKVKACKHYRGALTVYYKL